MDFFPLTGQPTSEKDWHAVQFVAYGGTESVVAFRMAGDQSERSLRLKGLRSGTRYQVKEPLMESAAAVHPADALDHPGLPVVLEREQGRLFHLREST